jgi:hypothetical protein
MPAQEISAHEIPAPEDPTYYVITTNDGKIVYRGWKEHPCFGKRNFFVSIKKDGVTIIDLNYDNWIKKLSQQ